jgi:hypothetical protein
LPSVGDRRLSFNSLPHTVFPTLATMQMKHLLLLALSASSISSSTSFQLPARRVQTSKHLTQRKGIIFNLRGGETQTSTSLSSMIAPATEALSQALVSGTPLRAVGALYAVASLTVIPMTFIRQAYSFSVGKLM